MMDETGRMADTRENEENREATSSSSSTSSIPRTERDLSSSPTPPHTNEPVPL